MTTDALQPDRREGAKLQLGAYGMRITGLEGARWRMQPVPTSAPHLRVETAAGPDDEGPPSSVDADAADLRLLGGGRLQMRRGAGRVVFSFRELPSDEDLLHPYLAPAAAVAHLWAGREAFHGGVFATSGGAVAVFAGKDGGKSTTLAWLAREHGLAVVADDLVVVDDGSVLAGPRCLDLRTDHLVRAVEPQTLAVVRGRHRLRLALDAAPAASRLIATVVLRWGAQTTLEPVPPSDRAVLLFPQRMYRDRLAGDPAALLEVTALPMLALTRPRGEAGLRDAAQALLDYFG